MAVKHPLARALHGADLSVVDVAARLGVDPKTVRRWLAGRVPYPRHRVALRQLTGWKERDLWPQLAQPPGPNCPDDEVRAVYPHRFMVPAEAWQQLFRSARAEIDILAHSGLFLARDAAIRQLLHDQARAGTRVRLVLTNPAGAGAARPRVQQDIGEVASTRIRDALMLFGPLTQQPGVQLRLHDTVLYNSIYRADNEMFVNTHLYGCPASTAPVLHLRRRDTDGIAATHLASLERTWAGAHRP